MTVANHRTPCMLCFVLFFLAVTVTHSPAQSTAFQPQTRLGASLPGDTWEPAIAADVHGHVYALIPDYPPTCKGCPNSLVYLVTSSDGGTNWSAPRLIYPAGSGQIDVQVKVDPVDGKTVYAAWLQNNKSQILVLKSIDFGNTWSAVVANSTMAGTDKDILVVHGNDVYVAYNHAQTVWASSSHDGGQTFTSVKVNANANFGWSLAGGGAIDDAGNVYFGWEGYTQNGGAKGPVNIYVTKSADGGLTWTSTLLDVSGAPPDCSAFSCGWAYLGPGTAMSNDAAGQLYILWNSGTVDKGPERVFYSTSKDRGQTWSLKTDVSFAATGVDHAFPAIIAGAPGDVRIAWMDARNSPNWNLYYRSSTNGGASWSGESILNSYVAGYNYIFSNGFRYPFGDYFTMTIDGQNHTQAAWGEGYNYSTPGDVWYTRQTR